MPKKAKNLSPIEISRITEPGRHAVGNVAGLLFAVSPSGARSWILRTKVGDKRRSIGLGGYPDVGLASAKVKAGNIKEIIESGLDPVEEKRKRKAELKKQSKQIITFAEAARQCHKKKASDFSNTKHIGDWISSINRYANPIVGRLLVSEIDIHEILAILNPIWEEKTETANRVRQRIEQILNWATVSGYRTGKNPARWEGNLDAILAKPSTLKKKTHFKALSWKQIGVFMVELRKRPAMTARALEWIILTACRSGECRGATWDEIDFKTKTWTVPADRMKMKIEHRVPLCVDAIKLLKSLPQSEGSPYLFTAPKGGPLSDMSISMLCRRMKVEAVPHGFRSTFKDWCSETTSYLDMLSEVALAHNVGTETQQAYRRGDLFDKRRRLMDAWAEHVNTVQVEAGENVTPIRGTM